LEKIPENKHALPVDAEAWNRLETNLTAWLSLCLENSLA